MEDEATDYALARGTGGVDPDWYLERNPDVAAAGVDPVRHYLEHGWREGRDPNALFDTDWYLSQHPDVAATGMDPLLHYLRSGAAEGRDPNPLFDSDWYLDQYPDVAAAGMNPLLHYLRFGAAEGRIPHASFGGLKIPHGTEVPGRYKSRMLTSPVFCRVPPSQYLSRYVHTAEKKRPSSLDEYLRLSLVNPQQISAATLGEPDLRIISIMDCEKRKRASVYEAFPQKELVSIIMPTHNRDSMIADAIISVLLQSYRNWELLVISDASTDATRQVVTEFGDARIRFVHLASRIGQVAARNLALREARGSQIAYLDDDDQWDPDFLLLSVNAMKRKKKSMVYSAQLAWSGFDEISRLGRRFRCILFAPFNRSLLENRNYISLIACVHDRALINTCGPFNEGLKKLVDWDLFLRMTEHQIPYALPCILSHYYTDRDDSSVSRTESWTANIALLRQGLLERSCWHGRYDKPHHNQLVAFGLSRATLAARETRLASARAKSVKIIISNCESTWALSACLASIAEHTRMAHDILIVDSDLSSETRSVISRTASQYERAHWAVCHAAPGTSALDAALAEVGDYWAALVLDSDTVVTPNWLEELAVVLEDYPDAGMAVPRQVLPGGHQMLTMHVPAALPDFEMDVNLSAHHDNVLDPCFDEEGRIELKFAPLVCALIRGASLRKLGSLDVQDAPHFGSDRIFCDFLRRSPQQKIIYTPFSKVYRFQEIATREFDRTSWPGPHL